MSIHALINIAGARFHAGEQPIAPLEAADIRFFNAQSIICHLLESGVPLGEETATRWLEMAAAPSLVAEAVAQEVNPEALRGKVSRRDILLSRSAPGDKRRLAAFVDSIMAAARQDPAGTLATALQDQRQLQTALDQYLPILAASQRDAEFTRATVVNIGASLSVLDERLSTIERHVTASDSAAAKLGLEARTSMGALAALRFLSPWDSTEVRFEFGSAIPNDSAVNRFIAWASRFHDSRYTFSLTGQADAVGTLSANLALSRRRAEYLQRVLVERVGIPAIRISVVGIGEPTVAAEGRRPLDPARRRVKVTVHATPER